VDVRPESASALDADGLLGAGVGPELRLGFEAWRYFDDSGDQIAVVVQSVDFGRQRLAASVALAELWITDGAHLIVLRLVR
jgi:hypothetical protein